MVLSLVAPAASLLPGLAADTRRFHDTGRSEWWCSIHLVPLIGQIVFLAFMASDGKRGPTAMERSPKPWKPNL